MLGVNSSYQCSTCNFDTNARHCHWCQFNYNICNYCDIYIIMGLIIL